MQHLSNEQVKQVIDGRGNASRVPLGYHFWFNTGEFGERQQAVEDLLGKYPCDIEPIEMGFPQVRYESTPKDQLVWNRIPLSDDCLEKAIDSRVVLENWDALDEFLDGFPLVSSPSIIAGAVPASERYRLAHWWFCFFERLWEFRGMENALMDFHLYPDEVHRLFQALTDFYKQAITRARLELHADGVFTSDDIGTQTGPFFSTEIFCVFFKPYYKQLIEHAHKLGMHFWIHSCGNIIDFLPEFIEIGLDVIHPIQKYTMDEQKVAAEFGDSICFWYGFDVQQIIPYGSPEQVRAEVRRVMDVFKNKNGRFMMTTGNASTRDWPLESIEALLDESFRYGRF